ncbi:hypothetical protein ABZW67_15405 [Streptomyces rubiginosohelvolus]|uniref:hypothetical protein n=1 Tax=Streptomyces rubiginosohelvolus TaxID=67362 RepID=UPI0033B65920
MPTDPNHRTLLQAVDRLTTQVRRIADTLEPPVVVADLGGQTTGDDTQPLITRTIAHWGPVCEGGRHPAHALQTCDEIDAFTTFLQDRVQQQSAAEWKKTAAVYSGLHTTAEDEVKQLRAELDRIRRALDPDDETYIQETVDDQLAMTATIARVRAVRDRWAGDTLEPGQVRRLLDDLTHALGERTK